MQTINFIPATDELGRTAPMAFSAEFPFQGIPLKLQSNSSSVIDSAESLFGIWRALDPKLIVPDTKLLIKIIVHNTKKFNTPYAPLTYCIYENHCFGFDGSNLFFTEDDLGIGIAFVTPEMAGVDDILKYIIMEGMSSLLTMRHDRSALSAGAVVHNGRAVMLLGRSGAGKSTLCYACLKEGFQIIADDALTVSIKNGVRLWRKTRNIHLLPETLTLFPELANIPHQIRPYGRHKIAIDVTSFGDGCMRLCAENPIVCILERNDNANSALEPIESDVVIDAICRHPEPGFDRVLNLDEVAETVSKMEKYRLIVGNNISKTIDLLRSITQ